MIEHDFWKWRKEKARDRLEIYLSILKAIQREKFAKPTHVMYKSNLSWIPLQSILQSLLKNRLIDIVEDHYGKGRRAYCLTDDGRKALEILENAHEIVKKIDVE
jgi:predicted transcriptional regulator